MNNLDYLLDQFVFEFKQKLLEEDFNTSKILFIDYAAEWFNTYKSSKEKNTQFMYKNVINKHFACLSGVYLSDIRLKHLQQIINNNLDHPRICEVIFLTFKQIINQASRDHLLSKDLVDDIVSGVSLPKKVKHIKRPLTDVERKALKTVKLSPMKSAFLNLIYYTGIRRGEALALTSEDFDFSNKILKIRKTLIFVGYSDSEIKNCPKTSNGFRDLPLPEDCISKIYDYVSSCEGFLFHGVGQGVVLANRNFYRRFWESIVLNLNIAAGYNPYLKKIKQIKPIQGLTAHIFRHDFCTMLCYQVPEISTKMIAYLLGDTEKMVLDVYSHIVLDKEKVFECVDNARKL